jgi:hypothetical protein
MAFRRIESTWHRHHKVRCTVRNSLCLHSILISWIHLSIFLKNVFVWRIRHEIDCLIWYLRNLSVFIFNLFLWLSIWFFIIWIVFVEFETFLWFSNFDFIVTNEWNVWCIKMTSVMLATYWIDFWNFLIKTLQVITLLKL